jgi:hypothetical protein
MGARLTLLDRPDGAHGPLASESDVHFFCTGRDRWSAYDRRLDPAIPGAFLGRLRRLAGIFEVSFADISLANVYCASLNDSRAHFVEVGRPRGRTALRLV